MTPERLDAAEAKMREAVLNYAPDGDTLEDDLDLALRLRGERAAWEAVEHLHADGCGTRPHDHPWCVRCKTSAKAEAVLLATLTEVER